MTEPLEKGRLVSTLAATNPYYPKFLVDLYNSDNVAVVESGADFSSKVYPQNLLRDESLEIVRKRLGRQDISTETLTFDEMVNFGILGIVEPLTAGFGGPVRNAQNSVAYYRKNLIAKTEFGTYYIYYNKGEPARTVLVIDGNTILNPGLTPITSNVDGGTIT